MLAIKQSRVTRAARGSRIASRSNALPVHHSRTISPIATPGFAKSSKLQRGMVVKSAAKDEIDFDKFLIIIATKWEEADNKAVVVGYSAAAVAAFFISEWFIHLPVLDFLLGFPVQLVGLLVLPYLLTRWLVDSKDWYEDVSGATGYLVSKLPYLEKKKE